MANELVDNMLNVRRAGVTETACMLHNSGAIRYKRKLINRLERPRLRELECKCYAALKDESEPQMTFSKKG